MLSRSVRYCDRPNAGRRLRLLDYLARANERNGPLDLDQASAEVKVSLGDGLP